MTWKKFQKIFLIGRDFQKLARNLKIFINPFLAIAPCICIFEQIVLHKVAQYSIDWTFWFHENFSQMNNMVAGSHFVFYSQIILSDHSNSPKGASDPKMALKPLNNIHLEIQTIRYHVNKAKHWEKHFPERGVTELLVLLRLPISAIN